MGMLPWQWEKLRLEKAPEYPLQIILEVGRGNHDRGVDSNERVSIARIAIATAARRDDAGQG